MLNSRSTNVQQVFNVGSTHVQPKKEKKRKEKESKENILKEKKSYGEFKNVFLTDEEYEKLKTKFDGTLTDKIENMSAAIESKGYKYHSHYAAILTWDRKNGGNANGTHQQNLIPLPDRKQYITPEQFRASS